MTHDKRPTIADHEDTHAAPPHSRQLNVLVVDGDTELTAMLEALLTNAGYRVVSARSAFMAREALAEERFPIVVIDRGLEDGDGIRLCTEIRQSASSGYVYIILLTARDSKEDVVAGLTAGADDYLSKKVSESELIARLNTASRIVRLERSLRESLSERTKVTTTEVLSGSHNRLHFIKQVARDVERALQAQRPLSLLAIDIDLFKAVNDRHGHVAGDELLRQLANRARFALPHDEDWIARIGGDEFVVALPGTNLRNALAVAERLRSAVDGTPFHVAGVDVAVTISIGAACLASLPADEPVSAEGLLDQADQFLYRSKLAGRNRVSSPPP
jgi:two-component system, cell cycle response regulator